ncbi:hypothetical protein PoB_000418900 [Plakobranchus ocellatus]|uniref:Uncharacterized protein n=1 Tax=Plakobranchus ocellatus TaxID=259542 RepID=A0AAV3Y3Y0_9GAST|nr:hypothetical protein PoB_000418900 [Plakobranchus ocellatus]
MITFSRYGFLGVLYIASPQQGDLRLSGSPSGQGAGGGARTRGRIVHADLRADSLATVPPTVHGNKNGLLHSSVAINTTYTLSLTGKRLSLGSVRIETT